MTFRESLTKWKYLFTDIGKFYKLVDKEKGVKDTVLSYLLLQAVFSIFYLFVLFFVGISLIASLGPLLGTMLLVLSIPIGLLILVAFTFLTSGVLHLLVMLFGGVKDFETTYKIHTYTSLPVSFLGFVPYVGPLVAMVAHPILVGFGLHQLHKLSIGRTVFICLFPIILSFVVIIAFFAFLIAIASVDPTVLA